MDRQAMPQALNLQSFLCCLVAATVLGCSDEKPPSTRVAAPMVVKNAGDQPAKEPETTGEESAGEKQTVGDSGAPPTRKQPAKMGSSAAPDRVVAKTFDDIKFDIEPDDPFERSMLTTEIEQLDGQRIRIRGYILPTPRRKGLRSFVLVRDNLECCFGPGAALYDCILVNMAPGRTAEFSSFPVAVEGRFAVDEFIGPDDRTLAIYRMEGESVER